MTQHLELALRATVPASDAAPDGNLSLIVRSFTVTQELNRPYSIELTAASRVADLDLEELVGASATFEIGVRRTDDSLVLGAAAKRTWTGYLSEIRQVSSEVGGLSYYLLRLVPPLWLLTQKVDTRIFQHLSELEVALRVLSIWGIEPEVRVDRDSHLRREYRTQYEETDFDFVNRMFEEAGVTYFFESKDEAGGRMVVADAPQRNAPRPRPLSFCERPEVQAGLEWASDVQTVRRLSPGKVTLTDHDFRASPEVPIVATAQSGKQVEQQLDVYEYRDGHFLYIRGDAGDPEDPADTEAVLRTDERRARTLAIQRLRSQRAKARETSFVTSVFDLDAGDVVRIEGHGSEELARDGLLLVETSVSGSADAELAVDVVGVSARDEYRPPLRTARPVVGGVESATIVGPSGEEIHVDRHGRVKVHFHWDRDGEIDEFSSCWMHTSQPWGGAGYGGTMLPRIGQEVLVGFFESDPDRPIIVGRYYTSLQQTPYRLPANKTQSGIKTNSTGGGGGYNELMFEDRGGSELLNMRAQRDMNLLVLNNRSSNIQANEGRNVGQERNTTIGQSDRLTAGQDIFQIAGNNFVMEAKKTALLQAVDEDIILRAKAGKVITMSPKVNATFSDEEILLKVGPSIIEMSPRGIIIKGPAVLINPDTAAANAFLADGTTPDVLAAREAEAQARQQRITELRATIAAVDERMQTPWLLRQLTQPAGTDAVQTIIRDQAQRQLAAELVAQGASGVAAPGAPPPAPVAAPPPPSPAPARSTIMGPLPPTTVFL